MQTAGLWSVKVFLLAIFYCLMGCGVSSERIVPEELAGFWETDEKQYEACVLEMSGDLIVFQKGKSFREIHYVKKIKRKPLEKKVLYRITYENKEKEDFSLSFYYSKDPGGEVLRFKNREYIAWRRKKFDLIYFP